MNNESELDRLGRMTAEDLIKEAIHVQSEEGHANGKFLVNLAIAQALVEIIKLMQMSKS